MKVAIIYNKNASKVINTFGMQTKEIYNPKTVNIVTHALEKGGHNVGIIDGDMHVIERLHAFMPRVVEGERMGIVFNMAYGIQGESRYTHIPSMLEMLGIPYVGSSPAVHALALDKVVTKMILQQHNLPTPNFWVFSTTNGVKEKITYPVIVKPKMESVSFGLRIVDNDKDLNEAVDYIIKEFQQPALVEQFIEGREFAVGLLGNNPLESFPVLEIDLENDPKGIQTYDNKSLAPRRKICPAIIPDDIAKEMIRVSKESFNALQLRDFARVDIRMDNQNNIYILELNSMASLGPTGSYPHAANVAGYNYQSLVNKMLDVAVNRYFTTADFAPEADKEYKTVPIHIRIRGFLRGRQNNLEKILREMVNTNSYYRNLEGITHLSNILKKQLSSLGFNYESFNHIEVGNTLFFTNTNNEEYDVLFLGNFDNNTILPDHEHYEEAEHKLLGTGIWESKGGLTIMLAAFQALRFVRILRKLRLAVLLTSDDTLQGKFSKDIVKSITSKSKYILGLHGAFLNGGLGTSRSGSAVYHLQLNLKNSNDALEVAKASSTFLKLITDISKLSDHEKGIILAPHLLNVESNITEPFVHGTATLSVRFSNTDQMDEYDKLIKSMVGKKRSKDYSIQIEGGIRRPSMHKSDKVIKFWNRIKNLSHRLDINLREEHRWSSADICFVQPDKYNIDGFGAAGAKPHKKSEFILRHSLLERSALLALLLSDLAEETKR